MWHKTHDGNHDLHKVTRKVTSAKPGVKHILRHARSPVYTAEKPLSMVLLPAPRSPRRLPGPPAGSPSRAHSSSAGPKGAIPELTYSAVSVSYLFYHPGKLKHVY